MSVATVDRLRFKVSSKLGNSYPRFYLKGAHPLEHQATFTAAQTAPQAAFHFLHQVLLLFKTDHPMTHFQTAAIECANYNANNLQPSISPSMNTPASRLLSASGMSNNKRERLGFNFSELLWWKCILATSFTYDKSFGQEGLKTHIEMTKSLVESLSFSYSSSQLSRITAGSNPKLSPSEFSHNSSPSGNNSTTSS
ncbi:hypothetical protein PPACK8108_LOCUS3826 [Phakopsora pachyrhizi]|uniref:Uncharacterized protein n=1 Tax=Phakopsora pachyrhizi TaxID=170000 RepID=A0AAV0AMY4_PHAPC|nr:hypothetical protein PPACK8108_LOCUS3826 [Phakopsora pachyrhizi]